MGSKLRGCGVVTMKVEDLAPSGYPLARATVRQRKTGRPVRFELTEQTRQAVDDYLKATARCQANFCSPAAGGLVRPRQYGSTRGSSQNGSRASDWSRTSLPRTRSAASTVRYLGIEVDDALAIAEQVEV